ncbi:MAG: hypothetical protein K5859_03575 [Atopobiaceae bacterium]|nr:hypothetical protein [Atopobiaceae bacterium]
MLYIGIDMLCLGFYGLLLVATYLIAKAVFRIRPDAHTAAVMIVTIMAMLVGYALIEWILGML